MLLFEMRKLIAMIFFHLQRLRGSLIGLPRLITTETRGQKELDTGNLRLPTYLKFSLKNLSSIFYFSCTVATSTQYHE